MSSAVGSELMGLTGGGGKLGPKMDSQGYLQFKKELSEIILEVT